jgi:hypothetical protein
MRLLLSLLLLPLLFGPALADEKPRAPQTPVAQTPVAQTPATETPAADTQAAPAPLAAQPPKAPTKRLTWQQHFAQANLAHDGHLTLAEATTGFPLIARHFDDIDADHKAYVTENDIRAWRVLRSATRRMSHPPADKLKPLNAYQLRPPVQPQPLPLQTASVPTRVPPAPRATRIGN